MDYGTCVVIVNLVGGAQQTLRCNSASVGRDPETGHVTAFRCEQALHDHPVYINTPAIASIEVHPVDYDSWEERDKELGL